MDIVTQDLRGVSVYLDNILMAPWWIQQVSSKPPIVEIMSGAGGEKWMGFGRLLILTPPNCCRAMDQTWPAQWHQCPAIPKQQQ